MGTVRLLGVAGGGGAGGQRTVVGCPEVSQVRLVVSRVMLDVSWVVLVSRVVLDVSQVVLVSWVVLVLVAAATSASAIVPAVRPRVFAGVDSRYLVVV
jgi:hypothetical protein